MRGVDVLAAPLLDQRVNAGPECRRASSSACITEPLDPPPSQVITTVAIRL